MDTQHNGKAKREGKELFISRVFDAPVELVYKAWSSPEHISQWWGPTGFTNTIKIMDFRPGGKWEHVLHGPDGTDYRNEHVFKEIVPNSRIVYTHVSYPKHDMEADFIPMDGRTLLKIKMIFESVEQLDNVIHVFKADEGLEQNLTKLNKYITTMTQEKSFTITRELDAPRELVYKVWTDPEHLAKWWGPAGFTFVTSKLDLRPGGMFHYCMRSPDGQEMWGKFVYRDIVAPERIEMIVSFSDKDANNVRHPWAPTWPLEQLSVLTLKENGNKTTLTLTGSAYNATAEEQKTFDENHHNMEQGFAGTFMQLDAYLAEMQK